MDQLAAETKRAVEGVARVWAKHWKAAAEEAVELAMREDLEPDQKRLALQLVLEQAVKTLNPPAGKGPLVVLNQAVSGGSRLRISTGRDGLDDQAEEEAVLALERAKGRPRIGAGKRERTAKTQRGAPAEASSVDVLALERPAERVEPEEEPIRASDKAAADPKVRW